MLRFHYIMAVWGERYRQLLVDIVLPTLLSPGNLSGCRYRTNSVFKICTLAEDASWLERHPLVQRLRSLITVEFHVMAPEHESFIREENAYQAMSIFHRHAIRQAVEETAYLVFMTADAIVSDGAFRALEDHADAGADCVVLCGIRCALEEAEPQIRAWLTQTAEAPRLTSRQMTDLLLRHPHRLARSIQWGAPLFNSQSPGHLYWFGEQGILAHGWHLHPWMIRAVAGTEDFIGTIDSDYVANAAAAGLRIHVVQDSDDLCVVELSRADHLLDMLKNQGPFDLARLQIWAMMACNPVHRDFFKLPILFKGTGYDDATLAAERAEAAKVVPELHARIEEALDETREIISLDDLRGQPAIYLYGSGQFGRTLLGLIRAAGIDSVRGFIDSDNDGQCDGLPVHALERFRAIHQPGDLILICSQFISAILERLKPLRPARVMTCYTFHLAHTKRHLRNARIVRWPPPPGVDPTRLSIHGIGSRGEGLTLPAGHAFADDVLCFNYEPDGDAIEQTALFHENQGVRQTTFPVAVAGRDGHDRLILNYDPFTSSLLAFNDAYRSFYCPYDLPNADYPLAAVCAPVRFLDVPVVRLDTLCQREGIGLDYAAIDTQGNELDVLEGMGTLADTSLLAFTAEVEFHRLYAGQTLCEDVLDFARRHGFRPMRMDPHPAGSFLRGPIGWRGRGLTPSADALFLKDIAQLRAIHPAPRRSLMKLAFLAFCFGNPDYALDCLEAARPLPPEEGDSNLETRGYVRFLRGLQPLLATAVKIRPPEAGAPPVTGQQLDPAELSTLLDPAATPFEIYVQEHGFAAMAEGIRTRRLRDAWTAATAYGLTAPGAVGSVREFVALDDLRGQPAIYLYGSGQLGRTLLGLIRAAGIDSVRGFIDSDNDGQCDGLPVHALERFRAIHQPGDLILICSQFVGAILERLRSLEPVRLLSAVTFYKTYMSYGLPERRLLGGTGSACRESLPADPTFLVVRRIGGQDDGLALPPGSPFAADIAGFDSQGGGNPDYVAIQAPGNEPAVLNGMSEDATVHLLAFTTTALFQPGAAGQGLFEDILRFAHRHGFHCVQTDPYPADTSSPGLIGRRDVGLIGSADVLFFKDIAKLRDSHPAPRRALLKLAFLALCFERLEYALECLEVADRLMPTAGDETLEARGYVCFLRGLQILFMADAKLQPPSFTDLFSVEDSFARFAPGGRVDGFDPAQVRQRYFTRTDPALIKAELPSRLDRSTTALEDYLGRHGFTAMAETVRINRLRHARMTAAALGLAGPDPWPDPTAVRAELERLIPTRQ